MRSLLMVGVTSGCLFIGGCHTEEYGFTGTIVVPTDVQAKFSKEKPGRVVIARVLEGFPILAQTVWTLCEPTSMPIEAPFEWSNYGCAPEGMVQAWVEAGGDPAKCGGFDKGPTETSLPDKWLAEGSAVVFKGKTTKDCTSSIEKGIRIQLAPTPPGP